MDVGAITISGLASDLDIAGIITQLAEIRQRPIDMLAERQTEYVGNLTVCQQLTAKVLALGTMMSGLSGGQALEQVNVTSSSTSAVVATGGAGAALGEYEIEVTALAENHKISSGGLAAADEALGYEGDFRINGETISMVATDSLEDVRDAINAAGAGATASILTVSDTDHRLVLRSLSTGESGALDVVDANGGDILEGLGLQTSVTSIKSAIDSGAAGDELTDMLAAVGVAMDLSVAPSGTVQINGVDVAINLGSDSLQDIATAIDALDGVSASVESTENGYRLEVVGDVGTPTFADDGNVLVTLGLLGKGIANEMAAAQDAAFTIDGVSMTRSTNAVDDAIENVQLQLVDETGADSARVAVTWDINAAVDEVSTFVAYYNDLAGFINSNQSFDSETETGGALVGSVPVMGLESGLREQVTGIVATLTGDLQLASAVGITTNQSDQLVFDSTAFRSALQSDPVGMQRLFGNASEASNAAVEVYSTSSATRDSGADGWALNITQVATQATALGAEQAGGITADETLRIGGTDVTLTAGMSLTEASDVLNALFTARSMSLEATVEGDRLQIQHELWGASYGVVITSSLDDGAGGTDFGGATAGVAENYTGQDVAGTIDGVAATGRGQQLTAAEGEEAEGLVLTVGVTSTGDAGVVRVSKGIASRLADYTAMVTDATTGSLSRVADGVSAEIEAIGVEIEGLTTDVERYITKLQLDFARMESAMAQSQVLLDWLTMQIDYLPGGSES